MRIEVTSQAFNPWLTLHEYEQTLTAIHHQYGAAVTFVGSVRAHHAGETVHRLFLEHYPVMTENHLYQISQAAFQQWQILDLLLIHRVGDMQPGETIVLIAVWSAHREAAFAACRFLIEELKKNVPFWKKETLDTGTRWVEAVTPPSEQCH